MATTKKPETVVSESLEFNQAEVRRRALAKHYREEERVPMYLSPMYRPYTGNVMTVSINGISVYFKVDGTTQEVPQSFADVITERRMMIDAILTKGKAMSSVAENVETSPGEIKLF